MAKPIDPKSEIIYNVICHMEPKSERIDSLLSTSAFVDMGHVARLKTTSNQYIEGRRGTGKTHLFKYFSESVNSDFLNKNEIAIFIDMRNARFESGPLEGTNEQKASITYKELIKLIVNGLKMFKEHYLLENVILSTEPSNPKCVTFIRSNNILREILRTIEMGHQIEKANESKRSTKESQRLDGNSTLNADVKGSFDLSTKLGIALSSEKESVYTESMVKTLPYNEIRVLLESFISILDVKHLYILLDEWSDMAVDVQPFIAEHIKNTFFSSRSISLKVATLPFKTKFSSQQGAKSYGFERGGDIYSALNLDDDLVYVRNVTSVRKNFLKLLIKHIAYSIEQEVRQYQHFEEPEHPLAKILLDMMESDIELSIKTFFTPAAYERLLKFSHGNPRDFLILFKKCYLLFYQDEKSSLIDADIVDASAKVLGTERMDTLKENPDAFKLLTKINNVVLNEKRLGAFLVEVDFDSNVYIQYLIHQRALHVWDRSYSSPNNKGLRYMVIGIDFCIMVDQLRSPNYRDILKMPQMSFDEICIDLENVFLPNKEPDQKELDSYNALMELDEPDKRQVRRLVLSDVLELDLDNTHQMVCKFCRKLFDVTHPVYIAVKRCPNCASEL